MKINVFLLLLLAVGVSFACKKELGEFLVGSYKVYNPHNGNETLLFQTDNGDTVRFYGNGRYSEIVENNEGDGKDYWINEIDICSFSTSDKKYSLRMILDSYEDHGVTMTLSFHEQVGQDTFFFATSHYSELPPNEDMFLPKEYLDSLQVFDKYYFEVYADYSLGIPISPTTDVRPITIYYTMDAGIIKIDFEDDSSWGLTQIISH